MATPKVRDLIKGSLRLIGAIATGETLGADELADALLVLNEMLDSWSTNSLFIYSKVRETFTLNPSQQTYTIGTTGNFVTSRPVKIEAAKILKDGSEYELEVLTPEQWSQISVKQLDGTLPSKIYAEGTVPLEKINLWPVPSTADTLVLETWKPLTSFASANDDLVLPPGYMQAMRFSLAIMLAPEYGKQASAEIVAGASNGIENIKRMNIKPLYMSMDPFLLTGRGFNILTGE